jgi:GAF domain-containing protein/HAMP domain-containing protein
MERVNDMTRADTRPLSRLEQDRIALYLSTALQPMPLLAALSAFGLVVIYVMGLLRVLDPLGWQLLFAALMLLLIGFGHRPILDAARAGFGVRAFAMHAAVMVLLGIGLALVWDGVAPLAILAAWVAPIICIPVGIPRRPYLAAIAASLVASVMILVLAARPILPRLQSNTTGSFAAVLLITSVVILFIMLVIATQAIRYRTLENRLVGTLVPIIAVPILFTTSIAAFNALSSSQQQFRNSLEAVSSLKRGQLNTIIEAVFSDLSSIQQGSQEAPSIMHVLQNPGSLDDDYRLNSSIAATQIRNVIVMHPTSDYEEVLILDTGGNAVLSTYLLNQGVNFADQEFFRRALTEPTARFIRYPGRQIVAGEYRLVGAAPFYGATPDEVLGVVVAVASPDAVLGILQPTSGLADINTYLIDTELNPVVAAGASTAPIRQADIATVIANRGGSGSRTYLNYAGVPVLGYYEWDPALQAAVVSEVPQNAVFSRSLAAVLASGLVGLITVIIAGIAVLSAARAISEPVRGLAQAAESLAQGQLATRASVDRQDEIGRLASSFNSMAGQLQGTIANLEQRVADRTLALEQQSLRLRTAAEIARDATLAPTLDELLSRAARLVFERFGVDHVGIYLLDEQRTYAVLQAAPSEAGKRMLAENYRVLVGDRGAIGQAAATGDAQLLLQGSTHAAAIGDEYHPVTASQLTLPLRTNEGTIGLLDLQSDTPQAFAPADTATIQVLADQLAAAIERGRLLLQVQERLGQLESSYRRFTQESWASFARGGPRVMGYRYDNVRLDPVAGVPDDVRRVLESGTTFISGGETPDGGQTAFVPIRLRGQTLGVVSANFRGGRAPERTVALIEQAADRLATALENVRLLEDSLRRASREQLIGEITTKIGSSISVRNVLQTAVEELGRALPGSEVSINFRSEAPGHQKESLS